MKLPESFAHRKIDRRLVLRGGLGVLGAAGLAAAGCAPAAPNASPSPQSSTVGMRPKQLPTAGARAVKASGQLDFVGFEGDDLPDILKEFLAASQITVKPNYQSGEPETLARLVGGAGKGVDLTSWTSGYTSQFVEAGALQPLDPQKLPNLSNLWPFLLEDDRGWFTNSKGEWIGVPQYWGGIGLVWDKEVKAGMSSWNDILDPALKGKVAMIDFPESIFQAAALAVGGIDPSRMTRAELDRLVAWLRPAVAQVKTFSPSFGDIITLMGSGEIAAVFPGFRFLANAAAEAGRATFLATDKIKEGAIGAIEILGIPVGADNPDAGYAFLNQMLEPKVSAQIAELQGSPGVVTGVVDLVSSEHRASFAYDSLPEFYQAVGLFNAIPRTSDKYVTQSEVFAAWSDLKSSSR